MKFRYIFIILIAAIVALLVAINIMDWYRQPVRPQRVRDTTNKAGISFKGLPEEDSMK